MSSDKFTALWVSHSSISDFLDCPRGYFLKNVYKNPKTGKKITLITPPLALGQVVHEVLEQLSQLNKDQRFRKPLMQRLNEVWKNVQGKKGGFMSEKSEHQHKKRAELMLQRVYQNPGPLINLSVKIRAEKNLPRFYLSKEDDIILCGKIDWLEYLPETAKVHIIDFKSGMKKIVENSLQLPIYYLLAKHCQSHGVQKVSYWFLETDNTPVEQPLPDLRETQEKILTIARKIKLARQLKKFDCPHSGCRACEPFEKILLGECEHVGFDMFGAEMYVCRQREDAERLQSEIL